MMRVTVVLVGLLAARAGAEPVRWGYAMTGGEQNYNYQYIGDYYGDGSGSDWTDATLRMYLNATPELEVVTPTEREVYSPVPPHDVPYGGFIKPYGNGNWGVSGSYTFRHEARSGPIAVTMTVRDFASGETAEIPLSYIIGFSDSIGERLYLDSSVARHTRRLRLRIP